MIKRPDYSDLVNIKTPRQKQEETILNDIKKIDEVLTNNNEQELQDIHQYIDGKYHSYISNWGYSMYGYGEGFGFNYEYMGIESFVHNLKQMKANLEGYACGFQSDKTKSGQGSNVNVSVHSTNDNSNKVDISVSITFEQARQQVENMTSLTDEQTREILDKISEIENTINGSGTKKSKWEKIKPVLAWLADKSFDVGMTLLPLLLKIGG